MVSVPFVIGMMAAYLFPMIRTMVYAGKTLRPMKVGIIEIIGSVQFLLLAMAVF